MKHVTTDTASRSQIIEILRTFKKENAEKFVIESEELLGIVARGVQNKNSNVDLLIKFKFPSLYLYFPSCPTFSNPFLARRWISFLRACFFTIFYRNFATYDQ